MFSWMYLWLTFIAQKFPSESKQKDDEEDYLNFEVLCIIDFLKILVFHDTKI